MIWSKNILGRERSVAKALRWSKIDVLEELKEGQCSW